MGHALGERVEGYEQQAGYAVVEALARELQEDAEAQEELQAGEGEGVEGG